ncbi:MAG: HEAT repeat domain-containing protein [Planctomycetes bacterium]|nr:HEAT repeat domain-containing protein [Planctomycetota bacterium]
MKDDGAQPAEADQPNGRQDGDGNVVRPMTAGLMTRLFAVPALIVGVVITCALLVTLAFGWIAAGQEESIEDLITRVTSGTGDKAFGVLLLPKDKELWQAALELARRLKQPEKEISAEKLPQIASQLRAGVSGIVEMQRPYSPATRKRMHLLAVALGRLKQPSAIDQFESMLTDDDAAVRKAAVSGMAELGSIPEMRERASSLIPVLNDDPVAEIRLIAATALGQIADPGDQAVIDALRTQLVDEDEVRWNVALALVRLGNESGKVDILDMLSREYWQNRQIRDDPESDQTRPISEAEIGRNIRSALTALDRVRDSEIRSAIRVLADDSNLNVAGDAREVLRKLEAMDSSGGG